MPLFAKRHYEFFAEFIRGLPEELTRDEICDRLCNRFFLDSDGKFKLEKFLKACRLDDDDDNGE